MKWLVCAAVVSCSSQTEQHVCPNGWVIFDFETPSGETVWSVEPEPGHCLRAETGRPDVRFFADETCQAGSACVVLEPGEKAVVAGPYLPSGVLGTFEAKELEGGVCPLACP